MQRRKDGYGNQPTKSHGYPSFLFPREAPAQTRSAQVESEAGGLFVQIDGAELS
jgi:hypothetical protein